eukprot:892797_1
MIQVFGIIWNHVQTDEFVTFGKNHAMFWSTDGGKLKKKRGLYGKKSRESFFCGTFSEKGYCITGAQNGSLYVWKGRKAVKTIDAHKGSVYALVRTDDGLISGGRDMKVNVINSKLDIVCTYYFNARVRALAVSGADVFVGLMNSEIWRVDAYAAEGDSGEKMKGPLVQGHSNGELCALNLSISNPKEFITAGEDNEIAVWNMEDHKLLRNAILDAEKGPERKRRCAGTTSTAPPNRCARAVAVEPTSGDHLAVGLNSGCVAVFDASSLERLFLVDMNKCSKPRVNNQTDNWIEALSYNPSGTIMAVGTHGSVIALCPRADDYAPKATLTAHNSPVTHLDWSSNGEHIRSSCIGYELLFHDVNKTTNMKQVQTTKQEQEDPNLFESSLRGGTEVQRLDKAKVDEYIEDKAKVGPQQCMNRAQSAPTFFQRLRAGFQLDR